MKTIQKVLAAFALAGALASCNNMLDVQNPNNQTTEEFGNTEADLEEALIACYNHTRMEGTTSRVGYMLDVVRGDEVWNASQVWYLPFDNLNAPNTDEIGQWSWRDWYYTINRCNFVITKVGENASVLGLTDAAYKRIKGQALFLRALSYYELATYYQTVPLFTDYSQYATLETIFAENASQDAIFDQVETDLKEAMEILPSRDSGGEFARGRATCGSAAGYYARALMFRHKYSEALTVLKDIIAGTYGHYELMADYGDNFREGTAYENNAESLYEVQYLDYGSQGTDDEWTPVNVSSNATNGHAIESNFAPACFGGWADLSMAPWLYNLFKSETCTDGTLDPRLYWTSSAYEPDYNFYKGARTAAYPNGDVRENVVYMKEITEENADAICTNTANGGIPVAKHTYARLNTISSVVTGLHCGVNLRMMRYSDVLLRAAECINEVSGPNAEAIGYINQVRNRAGLASLNLADFNSADKLFEQIANVERPKEFGCENGRGIDLIRWGFFYDEGRLAQLRQHGSFLKVPRVDTTYPVDESDPSYDSSFNYFRPGHEYFPIHQGTLNANPHLTGNSANTNTDNGPTWKEKYGSVHPVVEL